MSHRGLSAAPALLSLKKRDVLRIEKEAVIRTLKLKLITKLADMIEQDSDRKDFLTLCRRVDATIRSWYHLQFEELMQLYSFFEPVAGTLKLQQQNLSPTQIEKLEVRFLRHLMQVFEKSNFKLLSDAEYEVAQKGEYLLNLPIEVDLKRLDTQLLSNFFASENTKQTLPSYSRHYLLFRRGIDKDQTSGLFIMEKINLLIGYLLVWLLQPFKFVWNRIRRAEKESKKAESSRTNQAQLDRAADNSLHDRESMYVERVRLENMQISFRNLLTTTTIQEPTFERIILVYRSATPASHTNALGDRTIHIKQFRNIPMADMELVLPEKRTPGLTPMDTVKIGGSAAAGAAALWGSLDGSKIDTKVLLAVLTAVGGYIFKIYTDFQIARSKYQSLMVKAMYDKNMDSGRGTLLHLCDDVIQQEVKEVILAYFVLMTQGKLSETELDEACEELLEEEFEETTNFEVSDALQKLEKLSIVNRDSLGRYMHQSLKKANEIIGLTTDELVEMNMNRKVFGL
ncbi:hypothetical protein KFL_002750210 [Klebsormidium nitens]|uniref:Aminopeptidase n=1 Tax=Klebsormidium nitens TaxID=105231 RepID=A0A1Y1I6Q7_KLENI|nr:hypothetical protein KFL_002750210 [Klebsormidium nitens]|eukprot:GAQ86203.1 hypothetical protein KFL_002750210 [Klebsormidium nitens]